MLVALTSGRVARISARGVRQVLAETGEGRAVFNNARAAPEFESDCSLQIQAPGRPRPSETSETEPNGPYTLGDDP